jgi:DNA-binding HxlR family transcriptional regulator
VTLTPTASRRELPLPLDNDAGSRIESAIRVRFVTFIMKAVVYMSGMERQVPRLSQCPIARSLDRVGEWWSMLILRDAFYGLTRFDQFAQSLGIAPSMLARRLKSLVDAGLLERRPYQERPLRHDYVLTEKGRDFRPVLWTLLAWGNRHLAPEGESVRLEDPVTGAAIDPVVVDRASGRRLAEGVRVVPGPAADAPMRHRLAHRIAI